MTTRSIPWRARRRFSTTVGFLLLLTTWLAAGEKEEPDFFFLTGGPYTQKRASPQIIWASQWSRSGGSDQRVREYRGEGRFELGLTDRWEADFEFGAIQIRDESVTGAARSGIADFLIGARYRILDESFAPLTVTVGPQVVLPAASRASGFGNGKPGFALDATGAKDWGGQVFVAASLNLLWTPNVPLGNGQQGGTADLANIETSLAVAWRAVERSRGSGRHHDLHAFLEGAWERTEESDQSTAQAWILSPGVRYGFTNGGGALTEIGVALPVELNAGTPGWGWILQVQVEFPSIR